MDVEKELAKIKKGVEEIIQEEELLTRLKKSRQEGRPLKIKWGADPTAPDLHLGHMVILRKLKDFQELGHEVIFLIGDFTATIGDPSGRTETRPALSEEEVRENARTYQEQVFRILDKTRTRVVYNSSWLKGMKLKKFLELASLHTVSRMLERDEFQERMRRGREIRITEFLYPLLQAYDSVVLQADVEVGATEQKFNLLMGRLLQRRFGQEPQVVITLPVLEGLDGKRKMSKSLGNYIGISEPPEEIFGKIMSLPDELILKYFLLLTSLEEKEVQEKRISLEEGRMHPKELKEELALTLINILYSSEDADRARKTFWAKHKPGLDWEERKKGIEPIKVSVKKEELREGKIWICRLLTLIGATSSNSEASRLIQQGGVYLEGERIKDKNLELDLREISPFHIQVGKRRIYLVEYEK